MAEIPGADYANINIPSIFGSPSGAFKSAINLKERQVERGDALAQRQSEIDYRNRRDAQVQADKDEMDQYRKVQMLKEYTDLSKHHTGNDIADSIGNQKANELIGKWTGMLQQNKQLSYADLLSGVNKDMGATISALDGLKSELNESDEAIKKIKTMFPEADQNRLMQEHRADILKRRIDNKAGFINPMQVEPSSFAAKLSDPEYLSQYIQGNKNLTDAIINPKGADDASVYVGQPNDAHTKFEAKVPFWKTANFDPKQLQAGFLPKGIKPELKVKSTILPPESLPSSNGKPFEIIDNDVYKRFAEDPKSNLELIAATRSQFPGYDKFNPTEKSYAKRKVLNDQIKALDNTQFHATATSNAPRTNINIAGNKDTQIKDVYKEITDAAKSKAHILPINELSSTAQAILLKTARDSYGDISVPLLDEAGNQEYDANDRPKFTKRPINQSDIVITKDKDGKLQIGKVMNNKVTEIIAPVDFYDVNSKANKGVKAQQQVIKQTPNGDFTYKGKTYTENHLADAAKKSGMTVAEYKEALKKL